ncbi:MAG: recombination regulator RecX [Alcaligenaceae bacterium]|nr:recombination regulator RecX [Alcaligenaceae bacterium]
MNHHYFNDLDDDNDDFETVRVSKSSSVPAASSAARAGSSSGPSEGKGPFTRRASQPSQNNSQEIVRTSDLQKAKKATKATKAANKKTGISLLARAINLLSRREHSELELSRKLLPHAESLEELEQVLARLKKENWQSNQRFTHTFAQQKSSKWGAAKILQELKHHKLNAEDISDIKEELEQTEQQRAYEVWFKKFRGVKYETPQEYARQIRFLLSRGFSSEVVRKIVGGGYFED